MLNANDIMNPNPPHCLLDTPLEDVARRFSEEDISGILVLDEQERLQGLLTESNLIDQQAKLHLPTAITLFDIVIPLGAARFEDELARMQAITAQDLMHGDVVSIDADASLSQVAALMAENKVHHLPVIDDGAVVGLISGVDVIRALAGKLFAD